MILETPSTNERLKENDKDSTRNASSLPGPQTQTTPIPTPTTAITSSVLHRSLHASPLIVASASGHYLTLTTGEKIIDATGGAAVACLGHAHPRIPSAISKQMTSFSYIHSAAFTSPVVEQLASHLIGTTHGAMSKAIFVSSGSEATETALKLARQFWIEAGQKNRTRFVSRWGSYHGNTLGALGVSGHVARRAPYEALISPEGSQGGFSSRVSACFTYRGMKEEETESQYAERLGEELEDEFKRLGPENVCAFVAETVVGAALGCVPPVKGYFKHVRRICDKYGILLILDEVMCGVGRTGTFHAWEQEGIVPDIQTLGKGLAGGYVPVAAVLVSEKVVDVFHKGSGSFMNGQTYSSHPVACAGALEVQRVIEEEKLVENVRVMGTVLERLLKERLGGHDYVGDIRGRGLFWGIEFVADKATKIPFPPSLGVATGIHELGLQRGIMLYQGSGTVGGKSGDHILLAPAYNVTQDVIEQIVDLTQTVIEEYFSGLDKGASNGTGFSNK